MRRTTTTTMDRRRDRISELPDAILTHILSFLDTKYAVQTSSLSKRWNILWTSLTSLYFHYNSFRHLSTFQHFIDHVLTRRDNSISIDKFVFICKRALAFDFFEKVIKYATSNGVKHLEVCIGRNRLNSIPNSIFSAVSLRTLKLKAKGEVPKIGTPFFLEHLESLYLEGFLFEGGSDLFSKCKNLVELSIVDSKISISDKVIISAPQLARLSISLSFWHDEKPEVVLSLPKLTSFNFKARETPLVLLTDDEFLLLETVRIDLDYFYASYEAERQKEMSPFVRDMVQKFNNAQHVYLSVPAVELLYVIAGTLEIPPLSFSNLKTLTITTKEQHFYNGSKLVAPDKSISLNVFNQVLNSILQNSPHAELVMELPRCKRCKV